MCIRLAHLLRILLVSIKPVQASKAAKETIVYVHTWARSCTKELLCNRYRMVGSVLWIIKPMTPRAQPEGEGLYNP